MSKNRDGHVILYEPPEIVHDNSNYYFNKDQQSNITLCTLISDNFIDGTFFVFFFSFYSVALCAFWATGFATRTLRIFLLCFVEIFSYFFILFDVPTGHLGVGVYWT